MNKTYRNIWNAATGTWTAVAETAKSHSKGSARAARQAVVALALGGAAVGGAFAADACTTEEGESGSRDATGVCQVSGTGTKAKVVSGGIGTMATDTELANSLKFGAGISNNGPASATGGASVAVGANTRAEGTYAIAIGAATQTDANGGRGAYARGNYSIAMGVMSEARGNYSVALGANTLADRPDTVSVGAVNNRDGMSFTRQIVNVSAGTQDNDAVNLGQMKTALAPKVDDTYIKVNTGTYAAAIAAQAGNSATAIGANANANALSAVALGGNTFAAQNGTAIGTIAQARGANSTAVGLNASAQGQDSTAFGAYSVASSPDDSTYTMAIGARSTASARAATAIGTYSVADGDHASTLGMSASAGGSYSVALGAYSVADRDDSVSVGSSARQRQITNMAAGTQNTDAVNLGQMNTALSTKVDDTYIVINPTTATAASAGGGAMAIGGNAQGLGGGATAIGNNTDASGANSAAFGRNATASDGAATAIGAYASATGYHSSALGVSASAAGSESVALGVNSRADRDNSVSVGNASLQRQITNMSAGTQAHDAVNVSQLEPVVTALGGGAAIDPTNGAVTGPTYALTNGGTQTTVGGALGALDGELTIAKGDIAKNATDITTINNQLGDLSSGAIGIVQQDAATRDITVAKDTDGKVVDFTGTNGVRKLAGVDAGEVSATSREAINGAQLHGVADSVAYAIGAGSTVGPDGSITAPTFTVGDGNGGVTTVRSVGDVVTNLDGRVTNNESDIAKLSDQIGDGTVGLVQQDPTTRNITVAKDTDGKIVDFKGTDGARKLINVDTGEVSASSTEAVNGSQLHGVSESVASAIGGGSTVAADGSITAPTFTIGDGNGGTTIVRNVGDAVTNLDGRVTNNEGDIAKLADQIGDGTVGLVQQDATTRTITVAKDTDGKLVDFTGTDGVRKLAGVDAGEVSASSTEAINGSQLHGVSESVAAAIGAGSTVNPDGSITAPSFMVGDGNGGTTTVHNIGDVVTNLDGRVTSNEGDIAKLGDQLAAGEIGLVRQDPTTSVITVGATTGGTSVNFAGTDGTRTLSGVRNGVNDDDAVTIAQLKATGLIDYTGKEIAAVTYDDISLGSVTFGGSGGTVLHNVGAGLIAAGSMDAVNGGQLYDMQQEFAQKYGELSGQMGDLTDRIGELETGGGSGGGNGGGMGPGTGTGGDGSLVVGDGANASGENSTAVGQGAVASGDNGSAFGQGSAATGDNGTAIGQGSAASGSNGTAVGQGSVASGSDSTAIGQGSSATGSGSVAIGQGSVADRDNSVSVGSAGHERQITNVADGTAPTDAVNVRQMEQRFGETNRMINDVAKNAYAGVAAAMAMPNLAPSQPGKTVVAVGAANYKSGSAVAAGATYRTRDGKWLVNGALSVTSTGDAGVRAQVGYEF